MIPLTDFEEFLLWEDRPAYPWCVFCLFEFTGRLSQSCFEKAVQSVLLRHPLLYSIVQRRGRRWYWVQVANPAPPISWQTGPAKLEFPKAEFLDLQKEIGVRLFVIEDSEKSELTFQIHHCCCDGAGAFSFVSEVFTAYALIRGESSTQVKLPKIDSTRLDKRGSYGLSFLRFLRKVPKQMIGAAGAIQFMQRQPAPLVPHEPSADNDASPPEYPNVVTTSIDIEATRNYRSTAKRLNVSWNDLLMKDLFVALDRWRTGRGLDRNEWIRMMIPINLRSLSDRRMSAANCVSSVFIDRRGSDFHTPNELLQSVRQEMKLIKDNWLGLIFIYSLKLLKFLPGGLRKAARKDECSNSCIFSNLGKNALRSPLPLENGLLVVGDVVLQKYYPIAPLRPYSLAAFMSVIYGGQLALTMHYDSRVLTESNATEILSGWEDQILATIQDR